MATVIPDPFASATELLRRLRTREVSAADLLEFHIRRIARFDPTLNSIVIRNFEEARRAAREADTGRARGEDAPLLGLPVTIKDCIYVRGLPTTGGLVERAAAIAEADSMLAARVRAAGAVIIGKTNVPPYAADWQAANPLFGRTSNPWDPNRTSGGSTGGAAAVAAGLTPLEFGGDLGGSIRIPAAFCGIYGHKPSETAVPRSGHFPGQLLPNAVFATAVQGPLARAAEDLELALEVIAGPEAGEEVAWQIRLPPSRHDRLSDFRVAVLPPISNIPVDGQILSAVSDLASKLRGLGIRVTVSQPVELGDVREFFKLRARIVAAFSASRLSGESRKAEMRAARASGDEVRAAWADGLEGRASDYLAWFGQREQYRAAFRAFFRDWDVLLTPANVVNAFPHDDRPEEERMLDVNGTPVPYGLQSRYAVLANLPGLPATVFPVGFTKSGLPIGIQAIGPYLEDRTSIRFAHLVAQEFGGFRPPPAYA